VGSSALARASGARIAVGRGVCRLLSPVGDYSWRPPSSALGAARDNLEVVRALRAVVTSQGVWVHWQGSGLGMTRGVPWVRRVAAALTARVLSLRPHCIMMIVAAR
jgi:hypothetical protein